MSLFQKETKKSIFSVVTESENESLIIIIIKDAGTSSFIS